MPAGTEKPKRHAENNPLLTAAGGILCVILGFLLICNLTIIVKGTLYPDKPPSVLGITPMVVLSGSMSGTQEGHIEAGDLIFVGSADPGQLAVGDVIAYLSGGSTVTHRITAITTDDAGGLLFTTKGDANNIEDESPVTEDQLVGVYLARLPNVGNFALFLQQPLGMLLFIGVPLLAFIFYDILRRQRSADRQRRQEMELQAELERLRSLTGADTAPPPEEPCGGESTKPSPGCGGHTSARAGTYTV